MPHKKYNIYSVRDKNEKKVVKKDNIFDLTFRLLLVGKSQSGKGVVGTANLLLLPEFYANDFKDQTGQRRSNAKYATFATAITQAPHAYLIRALKHSGFFDVVERKGLDNLTKERQIIRTTRESFDEKQKVKPLLFAGLLMEGGVVGYETNIKSGGAGARYLGIGASKEYRQDSVTISLRTVSVSTGKILIEVLVTKSILSASVSSDVFRFYANNTELVEIESGIVENESINIALQMAIETAVLQTIEEGYERGYWKTSS